MLKSENVQRSEKIQERGITLIALVITIIVLLILAGVTLATLTGDSGILSNSEKSVFETEISSIEEEARLIYSEMEIEKYTGEKEKIELSEIADILKQKGYTIKNAIVPERVTDILLDSASPVILINGTETIKVTYEISPEENAYFAVIKGKYYKIKIESNKIFVERTATDLNGNSGETLKAKVTSGNTVTVEEIAEQEITVKAGNISGSSVITITYGTIEKKCTTTVLQPPTDSAQASQKIPSFSTDYGLIDIIWLEGTTNNVATEPNEPNLYTELGSKLKPVTWTYKEGIDGSEGMWIEDEEAKTTWYNYTADSGADGKRDNITSMWANAKNTTEAGESYFVWIPRYAYRITYYSDSSYTKVTGCYDGFGLWNAEDSTLNYPIDDGIEIIEHNEKKYIVHPAFMDDTNKNKKDENGNEIQLEDFDRGGWDSDLTGFWVAKYEMSRKNATLESSGTNTIFKSVPNVRSANVIASGRMYSYALNYDKNKESHLMKNSEWGAVAYLTQSKFGRNGHEIDSNNSSTGVTGNGRETLTEEKEGVTNYYNTPIGAKASTTGNIYGIYDMSGGRHEYIASYNKLGQATFLDSMDYGKSITEKDENGNYISTKYSTAYANTTASSSDILTLYKVGKVGDATKEVRRTSDENSWFSDSSSIMYKLKPFIMRGGWYQGKNSTGIFHVYSVQGQWDSNRSFRVVLCE